MKNIIKISMFLILAISILFIVKVKADTPKIEIINATVKEKSGTITVDDLVFASNEITSNVTFNKIDDFVTFELTLKNTDTEYKYKISSIGDNNSNSNISIEYGYNDNYISKDGTTNVTIKLKYNNKLINVDNISLDNLTINIVLVDEKGNNNSVIINPNTGDHLIYYIALFIVSLIGLIFAIIKKKNNELKVGIIVLVVELVMIPFTVFAYRSLNLSIKFGSIDIKGEFETYNITIDSLDGSEEVVKQITYGQKVGELPNNPTKEGYTFDKWVDQNGNIVTSETIITEPIEITAKYSVVNYTIDYNLDDGSLPVGKINPTSYNIESSSTTLENPNKLGYTFTGWTGTGLNELTTYVTIASGSTGNRSYTANYSPNDNTKYTVIHKYQNYDLTTYTEDVQVLTGTTDTNVTPDFQPVHGFKNPDSTQTINIDADEQATVNYIYNRKNFDFEITDRTYIDETVSTVNGSYLYETPITIKAVDRPGYTFEWSDGDTNLERTFNLNDNTSLSAVYTANTNTKYRVEHYKMKFAEGDYELADFQNLEGTTDYPINPAVNDYPGFISPAAQSTTIDGSGNTVVKYYYTRKKVTVTINNPENVVEGDLSGDYYYEEKITLTAKELDNATFSKWSNEEKNNPLLLVVGEENIEIGPLYDVATVTFNTDGGSSIPLQTIAIGGKATRPSTDPTKENYKFRNWYTDSNHETLFDFDNTEITEDTVIYAYFIKDEFKEEFIQTGECIFRGPDKPILGDDCEYANGVNTYIDTGINLYNSENHEKDYEIGFTIASYNPADQVKQSTIMNTKLEGNSFPGLVFRVRDSKPNQLDLSSRRVSNNNSAVYFNASDVTDVKIYRIYNETTKVQEIFYKINDEDMVKLNDLSEFNPTFDLSVWFGATHVNATSDTAQRHFVGTLKNMYIKVGIFHNE